MRQRAPAMSATVSVLLLVVILGVVVVPSRRASASIGPLVRAPRLEAMPPPQGSVQLGLIPPAIPMTIDVVLQPSNGTELTSLTSAVDNPRSRQYHHWLTSSELARRFGPSPEAVTSTRGWVASEGLVAGKQLGFTIPVTAPASRFESALGVHLQRYRTPAGRDVFASDAPPLVAQGALAWIAGIVGLDDVGQPASPGAKVLGHALVSPGVVGASHSAVQPAPCAAASQNASQNSALTPDAVGRAYGADTVIREGLTGAASTMAVFELAPYSEFDVSGYRTCFGLTNPVSRIQVDGGAAPYPLGTVEADADIEQAATQAPGASLLSYEGPDSPQGFFDTWNAIVFNDRANFVSTSWAYCEPDAGAIAAPGVGTLEMLLHVVFEVAAIQGQTILAASGDSGSEACFPDSSGPNQSSTAVEVNYPASDPLVTAVGGTTLGADGSEITWNTCEGQFTATCAAGASAGATGGGMSRDFVKPQWQEGIDPWVWSSTTNPCGQDCRGVPDISANAGTGEVFFVSLPNIPSAVWVPIGGTSIAAPLIAGLVADISGGCTSGALGDFSPALYAYAGNGVNGLALHDITQGDNDLTRTYGGNAFAASANYDLASGLGSPMAGGLVCPDVTGVEPNSALPGAQVTVTGNNLSKASVFFDAAQATVISADSTRAVVVVPPGSGRAAVTALTLGVGTADASFTYPAPVVAPSGQSPSAGPGPGSSPGRGYWTAGADGSVFAFGDAGFYGSMGGRALTRPVVGMAATPDGGGYWLVASDGGLFAFGDAGFYGSKSGSSLGGPMVSVVAS
jgi:subtilase family serine protease